MDGYRVVVPDIDYYRGLIKCQAACPVNTDARGYVAALAAGEFEKAYRIAREPNPFASVCGRVCNAPCEASGACRRGQVDSAVGIRALKRFLTERYGTEVSRYLPKVRPGMSEEPALTAEDRKNVDLGPGNYVTASSMSALTDLVESRGVAKGEPQKVAIIGAGAAGLTAARDLALLGYRVTLFEASSVLGGAMRLGIPEYRLPRDVLDLEIQAIIDLGIEVRLNTRVGPNLTLADLREQGNEAIFVGVGATNSRDLRIDGAELDGVMKAVEFLLNVNLGYRAELGERVLVIGGGNVAFDVARTVRRLETIQAPLASEDLFSALDAARMALRRGAREVHVVCLESREEMPASELEIEDGLAEGIILHTRRGPKRIVGLNKRAIGLETLDVAQVFDMDGRFNPSFIPGTEKLVEADSIIIAVGQTSDLSFLRPDDGIQVSRRGTIVVDPETMAATAPGIYAGGDVAFGPRILIDAVAEGHKAARAMDAYLQGGRSHVIRRGEMKPVDPKEYLYPDYLQLRRRPVPSLPLERRVGMAEVELGYDEAQAMEQARRCLKCHIQTIFNGDKCVLCGGCVDVCPQNCLKMVSLIQLEDEAALAALVEIRGGAPFEVLKRNGALGAMTAIIKDEERCIRCGLCSQRCPVGAITMEAFWYQEELVVETEELERQEQAAVRETR